MDLTMKPRILYMGDSHGDTWVYIKRENLLSEFDLEVCRVSAATAIGLLSEDSASRCNKKFRRYLAWCDRDLEPFDVIILGLGEVDCNCAFWLRYYDKNIPIDDQIEKAVDNMMRFVKEYMPIGPRILFAGPILPASGHRRKTKRNHTVKEDRKKRQEVTLKYNNLLKETAEKNNHLYMDINDKILDPETGFVQEKLCWNRRNYHLMFSAAAPLWIDRFREVYFGKIAKEGD